MFDYNSKISSVDDQFIMRQFELRASDSQALIWKQIKDKQVLDYLWFETFTTEQRISIWNRLEFSHTHYESLIKNRDCSDSIKEYLNNEHKNQKFEYIYSDIRPHMTRNDLLILVEDILVCNFTYRV